MRSKRLWTIGITVVVLGFVSSVYVSAQEQAPTPMTSQTVGNDALQAFILCEKLKAKKSMLWGQAPGVIYSDDTRITGRIQPGDYVRILTPDIREDGAVRVQVFPVDDRKVGRSEGRVWIDWASLVRSNTEHLMFECETTTVLTDEADQMGKITNDSVTFRVRIENVSGDSELPTPLGPGIWVLHSDADPLFTSGEKDRGHGLETLAENGNPSQLAAALSDMQMHAGVFNTPVEYSRPWPILPGGAYEFEVQATPDTPYLSFATMFVQSNDLFLAPDGRGLALFGKGGTPLELYDVTSHLLLWDAGTEANEQPGLGPNQAPRQSAANTGPADENETVHPVNDGFSYPEVVALVKVSIAPILGTGYASTKEVTPTATPTMVPEFPLTAIPDGTWLVGTEVSAGINSAPGGAECAWKRLSGFSGASEDTIAAGSGAVRTIVEIVPTDRGFSTSGCGQWTLVATPPPPATLTPTPTPTLTSTATPVPMPTVKIPQGWKRIEDDRLGYSLAVPFPWITFDLQSGLLDPIAGMLGGKEAVELLREYLDSPEGANIGILAIEPDISQLFARPPFPTFVNVTIAPLSDGITADLLVVYVKRAIESMEDVQLHSIRTGAVNGLPALQAVVTADLGESVGLELSPYLIITVLRANQTAYVLTIATRSNAAEAKQALINQIVGTFRPEGRARQARPTSTPTTTPTPEPAGFVKPGTHLVGTDIEPGVYVGMASAGVLCTWERLNSLGGDIGSVIAIGVPEGLFYVEVLDSDLAFTNECALLPFEQVPARAAFLTSVPVGAYLVGRDIAPGLYQGAASPGALCTWERLNSVRGDSDSVKAVGTPEGQYYVAVSSTDYAVRFGCPVEKVE